MEFRTKVGLPAGLPPVRHEDGLLLWGSCFAEYIGRLFAENKFRCDVNPFGVLYNPASIAGGVMQVLEGRRYAETALRQEKGVWYSLMHHSSFSSDDREMCLRRINARLEQAGKALEQARWMIFTWGTAWVYEWKETGQLVGNCHKLPDACFTRRLLPVDEIVEMYARLIGAVTAVCPGMRFLFTVSPVRHARDGMHGNQVSKSVLHLAVHRLTETYACCHYFPAYEILMDELRDYRFYADDMLHPSPVAISYIWECFARTFFPSGTVRLTEEWQKIRKGLEHRPFNPLSEDYQRFLSQILLKIKELKEKFPYLDVQNEIELCQARLKR